MQVLYASFVQQKHLPSQCTMFSLKISQTCRNQTIEKNTTSMKKCLKKLYNDKLLCWRYL